MSAMWLEDEVELQTLLKQLLRRVQERISGAPSVRCAEEILLHLEETDKNFHNYEFVKYLRCRVEACLGGVIDEATDRCARAEGPALGSGHDTLVHAVTRQTRDSGEYKQMMQTLKNTMMVAVESLINKFEEDQVDRASRREQTDSQYTDNCSDSDSSFNQVPGSRRCSTRRPVPASSSHPVLLHQSYAFIRREQAAGAGRPAGPQSPQRGALCRPARPVLCSALRRPQLRQLAGAPAEHLRRPDGPRPRPERERYLSRV
uniref:BROMI N-terminal domain-containing protein n=1 Tax=Denticeps clupeoides TaxID=299321 RepID=A0AAY4CU77_9TELE